MGSKLLALVLIGILGLCGLSTLGCSVPVEIVPWGVGLAFDGSGNPVIAYVTSREDDLKCAQWNGSAWVQTTVDSNSPYCHPSLAIDGSGNPAISYGERTLRFARWSGSEWIKERVDDGSNRSLAFDGSGNPAIVYCCGGSALKLARWDDAHWVYETVCASCDGSLGFDGSANPAIAYASDNSVILARWDGTAWAQETVVTVESEYPNVYCLCLAVSGSGKPGVAYVDYRAGLPRYPENRVLRFAGWDGTDWVAQTVMDSEFGDRASLAFDPKGNPAIAMTNTAGPLKVELARWDGNRWARNTVDAGEAKCLAFDATGNPAIVYEYGSVLKLARWDGVTWAQETVVEARTCRFHFWGFYTIAIVVPVLLLLLVGGGFYAAHSRLVLGVGMLAIVVGLASGIGFAIYANETPTPMIQGFDPTFGLTVLGSLAVSFLCICAGVLVLVRLWLVRRRAERPASRG